MNMDNPPQVLCSSPMETEHRMKRILAQTLDDSNDHAAVPVWTMLLVITQHRLHANPGKNHLHCLRMGTQVAKPRTWDLRLPGSSKLCQVVRSALTLVGRKGRNADPGRFWS